MWTRNYLRSDTMKNLEGQIDGPCRKIEAGILSSPLQFGVWETFKLFL